MHPTFTRPGAPPAPRPESCARCGARAAVSGDSPLCSACADSPFSTTGAADAAHVEPVAWSAFLASATPFFLKWPDTLAFVRPGRAFALHVDYVALASGWLAIVLGALALALLRSTRPDGRAKALIGATTACIAGVYDLGLGLGFY